MSSANSLPYLGSKISLISNAGIRYEGILFNINPQESTVSLSHVRAFGTEGRGEDAEVAPSDDVYEYIIFRGMYAIDCRCCVYRLPDSERLLGCRYA